MMFEEIIVALISITAIVVGLQLLQKGSHLLRNGKKAKAIVFKNNHKVSRTRTIYYPVVRFLTERQEWITQELSIGSSIKKEDGTSLNVIYDPYDPNTVEIDSEFRLRILPTILLVLGFIGLIIVVLELFDLTQLIN